MTRPPDVDGAVFGFVVEHAAASADNAKHVTERSVVRVMGRIAWEVDV
jgi:hypothetical protein